MQIVIDISEKQYEIAKEYVETVDDKNLLAKAIVNGTVLAKGHGDLIDRNEAEEIANKMFEHITSPLLNHIQTYDAYNIIRSTPTVIDAESEVQDADSD